MQKILLIGLLFLSACAANTKIHGSLIKPADIDRLRVGVTTQQDVLRILGTPSTRATLNKETWYYITDVKEYRPLLEPTLKTRFVVGLIFNNEGVLDRIFDKDEMESKIFEPDSHTTNATVRDKGMFEQIYSNTITRMRNR